MLQAMWDSVMS